MKLFFRIIFKIFLILTILVGCATIEEIKETGSEALLNQGIAFAEEGQYDLSINCFNKAIEINPRYAKAYYNRGLVHGMGKGQYDKAISDFNKAIDINPRFAEAYINCGVVYYKKGQYDKAIADYTKAIEINPSSAMVYTNRGLAHAKKGKYDKAIVDFTKAIKINPSDAAPYIGRGFVYLVILGNMTKACSDWKRACELGLCENYERAKRKGDCRKTSDPLRVQIR